MPRKVREAVILHVSGVPLDVPPPERQQLLQLGLLHEESFGEATRLGRPPATGSKRSKPSGASKLTGTK